MESVKIEVIATGVETHFKRFNVLEHRQTDQLCLRIVRKGHENLPSPIMQASKKKLSDQEWKTGNTIILLKKVERPRQQHIC